jgi:hypothetical protein
MPDWLKFFVKTIGEIKEPLAYVLNASGCREGWLQGEFFRAGKKYNLRVNEYALGNWRKADLSCGAGPAMLAEIKVVGANYLSKMQGYIEADANRMRAVSTAGTERYMILIIPDSDAKTNLGEYLDSCTFSANCVDKKWPGFRLRIWKL